MGRCSWCPSVPISWCEHGHDSPQQGKGRKAGGNVEGEAVTVWSELKNIFQSNEQVGSNAGASGCFTISYVTSYVAASVSLQASNKTAGSFFLLTTVASVSWRSRSRWQYRQCSLEGHVYCGLWPLGLQHTLQHLNADSWSVWLPPSYSAMGSMTVCKFHHDRLFSVGRRSSGNVSQS